MTRATAERPERELQVDDTTVLFSRPLTFGAQCPGSHLVFEALSIASETTSNFCRLPGRVRLLDSPYTAATTSAPLQGLTIQDSPDGYFEIAESSARGSRLGPVCLCSSEVPQRRFVMQLACCSTERLECSSVSLTTCFLHGEYNIATRKGATFEPLIRIREAP